LNGIEITTGGIIIIPIDINVDATMKSTIIKGMKIRNVGLSTKHALVLTSTGIAAAKDIKYVEDILRNMVLEHYGVELEREPIYL